VPAFKDRTGDRYGRLVVSEYFGKSGRYHIWKCDCDCGKTKNISSCDLSSKKVNSCGCLKLEKFLKIRNNQKQDDRETLLFRHLYCSLKRRHKKFRGDIFNIESFIKKSKLSCFYCGENSSKTIPDYLYDNGERVLLSDTVLCINGIDRKDPTIGYTEDNTVPCCTTCNIIKFSNTEEDFYKKISNIYQNICATGVACKNTNRKFIGIEMDDTYYELGKERVIGI